MNPRVDKAGDSLIMDLAHSQTPVKMGFFKGSGLARSTRKEAPSKDNQYTTDGLRVVLVFGERPSSSEEIDFLAGNGSPTTGKGILSGNPLVNLSCLDLFGSERIRYSLQ